ncbi:hypothetical protein L6164_034793 [Bauhinia variegata]|uniref:Uncharacterized protein n=1 Tax=Bauhinia variegata TaxID=167791 RepID=A0ACB9KWM8_BAUVA|nr:hypothetical protein L6164_034793 [Bauhinia variegata]
MNRCRLVTGGGWLVRQLCTAPEKASEVKQSGNKLRLYRKLSSVDARGETVSQTLNQYIMDGKAVKKYELGGCIKELRKYKKFQHALEIMEWMEMRKINFSFVDHAVHLDLISKTKGVVAAENYFNNLPSEAKNKLTYGALLNCYSKEAMEDKALAIFEKMNELNYVSTLAFNNLMSLYMRLGQPENVHRLVCEMKQRNVPLDSFTYHVWMNSYASLNDIAGAERVYEEMKKEDGQKISWTTYSNLAAIYVKAEQFQKAESALKMLEKKVKPRQREAYHFLLSLYGKTGSLSELYRIWNSLKSVNPVTNMSYLIMFQALSRLKDIEGLTECYKEWKSSCTTYDIKLANTVVDAYLSQDMLEEAKLVLEDATRRGKGYIWKIHEMLMLFFLKHRKLDEALSHLGAIASGAKDYGWCPSSEVLNAFLKYYEDEKDVDGVQELQKILKAYNFNPSLLEE